jgi:hypothetical protein
MSTDNLTRNDIVAIKAGITKGTPEDSGTGDGIFVKTADFPANDRTILTNQGEFNRPLRSISTITDFTPGNAVLAFDLAFEGRKAMRIIKEAFGAKNGAGYTFTADDPELGLNKHEIVFQDTITTPDWCTILKDIGDEIMVCESAVLASIKIETAGTFMVTATYIVDKSSLQSGFTNTATYDDPVGYYDFVNCNNYFRMNDASGVALDTPHNQNINALTMDFIRGWKTLPPEGGGCGVIPDVYEDDPPDAIVTLTYSRKTAQNKIFFTEYETLTDKKMEFYFRGPLNTVEYKSVLWQFPRMEMLQAPTYGSATPHETQAVFSLMDEDTAPAGMTGILRPKVTIVNEAATIA